MLRGDIFLFLWLMKLDRIKSARIKKKEERKQNMVIALQN
jgi:hypothetical protein